MATDSVLAPKGALFLNSPKAHSKSNRRIFSLLSCFMCLNYNGGCVCVC